jgi:hypothetical protein
MFTSQIAQHKGVRVEARSFDAKVWGKVHGPRYAAVNYKENMKDRLKVFRMLIASSRYGIGFRPENLH